MARTFRTLPVTEYPFRKPKRNNANRSTRYGAQVPDAWDDIPIAAWREVKAMPSNKAAKFAARRTAQGAALLGFIERRTRVA